VTTGTPTNPLPYTDIPQKNMQYRRTNTKGGCYFFTVNLAQRNHSLLTDEIDKLRNVMAHVKKRRPFKLDAIVVLPEHLHALWTLPEDDCDFATRWILIKAGFSRQLPKGEPCNASRRTKGERGIWQRRYWEHLIRDEEDFKRHVDYIHYNAVKHGHVNRASDWPYSSIHQYIANGTLPENWGCGLEPFDGLNFGEKT
jgi:putative transposase